jgi:hypothetical protein
VKLAKKRTAIHKATLLKTVIVHRKFVEFAMEEKQKINNSKIYFRKISNVFQEGHRIIISIKT